jgi:ribonuclease P protein component
MPKKHRLSGAEIRRLSPEKRLNSSLFSLSASKNAVTGTKVACVVSKKVSMKAVVRNTVKRRMRTALRTVSLPEGLSLILTAKKPAAEAPLATVRDDVASLVERLRSGK